MIHDVMEYFGLEKEFRNPGTFFEPPNSRKLYLDLKAAIKAGHLIALTGIVGCGKTTLCRRFKKKLFEDGMLVSTSFAVEKERVTKSSIIQALFADVNTDKKLKLPRAVKFKEKLLCDLIRQHNKPVALFIDDSHEFAHKTLSEIKGLMKVSCGVGGILSVILVGHLNLLNKLKKSGVRITESKMTVLIMNGIKGNEKEYFSWLLEKCLKDGMKPNEVFTEEAARMLTEWLKTPLQFNYCAWRTLVEAHEVGQKPVEANTVKLILSQGCDR